MAGSVAHRQRQVKFQTSGGRTQNGETARPQNVSAVRRTNRSRKKRVAREGCYNAKLASPAVGQAVVRNPGKASEPQCARCVPSKVRIHMAAKKRGKATRQCSGQARRKPGAGRQPKPLRACAGRAAGKTAVLPATVKRRHVQAEPTRITCRHGAGRQSAGNNEPVGGAAAGIKGSKNGGGHTAAVGYAQCTAVSEKVVGRCAANEPRNRGENVPQALCRNLRTSTA